MKKYLIVFNGKRYSFNGTIEQITESLANELLSEFDFDTAYYIKSVVFSFLFYNESRLSIYGCRVKYDHNTINTTIKPIIR